MDDATASDNCGEVTIEVSSETTPATHGQLHHRSHVHCDGRRWQQRFYHTDGITVKDTTAPEFTFVLDYTVECSDEMPMDDATASDN